MSAVKAILLVVVDIKDSSPMRPLVPRHICEVPVVTSSARSNNSRPNNPLQEMKGRNRADTVVGRSRGS